jgi:hypothetical protein
MGIFKTKIKAEDLALFLDEVNRAAVEAQKKLNGFYRERYATAHNANAAIIRSGSNYRGPLVSNEDAARWTAGERKARKDFAVKVEKLAAELRYKNQD